MQIQQTPKINSEFINNIFKNIEARNNKVVEEIKEDKEKFDKKTEKIIKFILVRNKVDKLECAYNLMINPKEAEEIKRLTEKTEDKLMKEALKKAKGDKKKAISLLFDPSSDISV